MIYGIGVDLVNIERIEKAVTRWGERFIERVFTAEEAYMCSRRATAASSFALRFAAKEAVLKALGTGMRGRMKWTDVEIANDDLGKPEIALSGESASVAEKMGVSQVLVSISHTREHAVASAIAMGEEI